MQASRRGFLLGFGAVLAAPAIVRVTSLMPVAAHEGIGEKMLFDLAARAPASGWIPCDGRLLSRSEFPELFQKIGNFASREQNDSMFFNLPNLRYDDGGLYGLRPLGMKVYAGVKGDHGGFRVGEFAYFEPRGA